MNRNDRIRSHNVEEKNTWVSRHGYDAVAAAAALKAESVSK